MGLRNKPAKDLTPAQRKQLARAELGRKGTKTIRREFLKVKVPATGHPYYRNKAS